MHHDIMHSIAYAYDVCAIILPGLLINSLMIIGPFCDSDYKFNHMDPNWN